MITTFLSIALLGCGVAEPPSAPEPPPAATPVTPVPATTPPVPEVLPPPTEPLGGPLVLIRGNFIADEIALADGEEVQVICKDQLVTGRVTLIPVGEGRVTLLVDVCPDYDILLRGTSDWIGSGSISLGIGRGPFTPGKPRDYESGYAKGVFRIDDNINKRSYSVVMDPDDADPQEIAVVEEGTRAGGLNWIGDLDDDNVPDFIINTPHSHTVAHTRLYLSARSKTRQPEQVAETVFTLW